jgi:orotate phosphoribosyltransferase
MKDLVAQYPFYYAADLEMPQWEPAQCPLCQSNKPLMSWKDMPEL